MDLLPIVDGGSSALTHNRRYPDGTLLPKDVTADIVAAARSMDLRRADCIIEGIVTPLLDLSIPERKERVPELVGQFEDIHRQHSRVLSSQQSSCLMSIVTLARYELECVAESYIGSFVIPERVTQRLPKGDYLEVAVGPGANVRHLVNSGKPNTITGCDISKRMVMRSMRLLDGRDSLFFRADAGRLPILSDQYDVVVILNAIDRLSEAGTVLSELSRVLRQHGTILASHCVPLQYETVLRDGTKLTYSSPPSRIVSIEDGIEKAGCAVDSVIRKIPWGLETVIDREEDLLVDIIIGMKR